jgi:hypothetical protein
MTVRTFHFDSLLRMTPDLLSITFHRMYYNFDWEQDGYQINLSNYQRVEDGFLRDIKIDGVYCGSKVLTDKDGFSLANYALQDKLPFHDRIGTMPGCQADLARLEHFGPAIAAARHLNAILV